MVGRSAGELRAYVEGEDPVYRGPFMQLVVEGLTKPLDDEDHDGLSFDRSRPRLLDADTEDDLQQLFVAERWTDFLPIVLPTEERVDAMLAGTSHARTRWSAACGRPRSASSGSSRSRRSRSTR